MLLRNYIVSRITKNVKNVKNMNKMTNDARGTHRLVAKKMTKNVAKNIEKKKNIYEQKKLR